MGNRDKGQIAEIEGGKERTASQAVSASDPEPFGIWTRACLPSTLPVFVVYAEKYQRPFEVAISFATAPWGFSCFEVTTGSCRVVEPAQHQRGLGGAYPSQPAALSGGEDLTTGLYLEMVIFKTLDTQK